ncbi:MAG: hypothetical protein L0Y44_04415 [Phycisphaerales bacterium]|nr:hypothetical protein [Phycisphaerales bacterium]
MIPIHVRFDTIETLPDQVMVDVPSKNLKDSLSDFNAVQYFTSGSGLDNEDGSINLDHWRNWLDANVPVDFDGLILPAPEGLWIHNLYGWEGDGPRDLAIAQGMELVDVTRKKRPAAKVSIYGIPNAHLTADQQDTQPEWRERMQAFSDLLKHLDCLCPSLYLPYPYYDPTNPSPLLRNINYSREVIEFCLEFHSEVCGVWTNRYGGNEQPWTLCTIDPMEAALCLASAKGAGMTQLAYWNNDPINCLWMPGIDNPTPDEIFIVQRMTDLLDYHGLTGMEYNELGMQSHLGIMNSVLNDEPYLGPIIEHEVLD